MKLRDILQTIIQNLSYSGSDSLRLFWRHSLRLQSPHLNNNNNIKHLKNNSNQHWSSTIIGRRSYQSKSVDKKSALSIWLNKVAEVSDANHRIEMRIWS